MTDVLSRLKTALADRYTIERELGAGGMATVYLAHDLKHERLVAVKVLRPELAAAIGPERFLQEIKITARLTHPHILPLHDSGEAHDLLYYVMPYIEGASLRERVDAEKQLPVDDVVRIARQVADALAFAHAHDVVHRDIKPENVLLEAGHAVVADFGIARAMTVAGGDSLTETGLALGTPAYMSTEQAAGESELDGRSDIYSLGCVVYELLAGQPPFTGPTVESIVHQQLAADPPHVTSIRSGVPGGLDEVLRKALSKTPADRYRTAAEFAEAVAGAVSGSSMRVEPTGELTPVEKSIAVLPFANMSPDPEMEYFSDGMTEEIINTLTQLGDLRVAARTSSFWFKGRSAEIAEVGEKLNVATVLEGSVRRAGDKLRITAQLVNIADGYHLWSERYDREMDDVFAIQDEIAASVVEMLKVSLLGAPEPGRSDHHTDDLEAYELCLKGRYFWNQRGAGLQKGLEYFERAVERDPEYALAHAGVADAYSLLGFYGAIRPCEAFPKAKTSALRALQLDPKLAEAHVSLGLVGMMYEWDWPLAKREFLHAIELEPRNATARYRHGQYLYFVEADWDAAIAEIRHAVALDPLSSYANTQLGGALAEVGRCEEALSRLEKTVELDPNFFLAHYFKGKAYRRPSLYEQASAALERAISLSGRRHFWPLAELAHTHAAAGRPSEPEAILEECTTSGLCDAQPLYVAMVHFVLARRDEAYEWLEKAFERRDGLCLSIHWYLELDAERNDPRFQDLLRRLKLPES